MKLTVIGCYGAYPPAGGATSGYLLESGKTKVLLDCGSGVLSRVQRFVPLGVLDAVVISHYHTDHYADLGCLQYAAMIDMQLGRRQSPLAVWGPSPATGAPDLLTYKEYCLGHFFGEKGSFQVGELLFEALKNPHEIESYSLRVTGLLGERLVFSGDTAYHEGLAALAEAADCFLCECSFYATPPVPKAMHLTSAQVGQLAVAAQPKQLLLTHLPHYGDTAQLLQEVRSVWPGSAALAQHDMALEF